MVLIYDMSNSLGIQIDGNCLRFEPSLLLCSHSIFTLLLIFHCRLLRCLDLAGFFDPQKVVDFTVHSSVQHRVLQGCSLQQIGQRLRNIAFDPLPGDGMDHNHPDLAVGVVPSTVIEVYGLHFVGVYSLLTEIFVEVAHNGRLRRFEPQAVDCAVDLDRPHQISSADPDAQDLALPDRLNLVQDGLEPFKSWATKGDQVDHALGACCDQVADCSAMCLDAVAIVYSNKELYA